MGIRGLLAAALLTSVAACGDDGGGGTNDWSIVNENIPAAMLGVWAGSDSDVWTVGGDPRDGGGPLVYHYDGIAFTKMDTTLRNVDLWWVHGFPGGPVFMSGSNGTIVKYENGTFTKMQTPGVPIVFGMWGATANDMWAVGGTFGGNGFVWHYDGTAWTAQTLPADVMAKNPTIWKVGGLAANDVWMSGAYGVTMHWDGTTLTSNQVDTESSLFSVAGNADRFITVGGAFDGEIYENDGTGWTSALERGGPLLSGVTVHGDVALAVGDTGVILRRGSDGKWTADPHVTAVHLHAAFIDSGNGAWAVGGDFNSNPTRDGVLLHSGRDLGASQ